MNPYGEILTMVKKELVVHVEKCMGTRLRNTKNKGIGGRGTGKLTQDNNGIKLNIIGLP